MLAHLLLARGRAPLRRVHAGQPVIEGTVSAQHINRQVRVQHIDTEQLQDSRAIEQFGESSQSAPCPPGFCGFDARCSDRGCPGHPAHAAPQPADDHPDDIRAMQMLGWGLVALAATALAVIVALAIGLRS